MARTVYYTAATLDGYLADEQDSLDWLFTQDIDREGPMNYDAFIADVGAIVMGRTTYEWIRDHMESTGEEWSYAVPAFGSPMPNWRALRVRTSASSKET